MQAHITQETGSEAQGGDPQERLEHIVGVVDCGAHDAGILSGRVFKKLNTWRRIQLQASD